MRLRVADLSQNVLDYKMEPAFLLIHSKPIAPPRIWPPDGGTNQPLVLMLRWNAVYSAQSYHLQFAMDSVFSDPILDVPDLAQTQQRVGLLQPGTRYYWRVNAINDLGAGMSLPAGNFTTTNDSAFAVLETTHNRWNLVSIPFSVQDRSVKSLFPSSRSAAYTYSNRYLMVDSLMYGAGYWLNLLPNDTFSLGGRPISSDTVEVRVGWNIVGSISSTVSLSDISADPPGMVTSKFYCYKDGYNAPDSILPGYGYWVKVHQNGTLYLATTHPGSLRKSNRIVILDNGELPPPPPDEPAGNGNSVGSFPHEFALAQNYPNPFNPSTTITYQLPVQSQVTLRVFDVLGREAAMLISEIQDPGFKSIEWRAGNCASGIYYYRLTAGSTSDPVKSFTQVRKMLFIK
jgi:hypothetical protein